MKKSYFIILISVLAIGSVLVGMSQKASAADKDKYGGTLKIAMSKSAGNFGYGPGIRGTDQGLASDVMEMLVNTTNKAVTVPKLATSWEVSPDGKSYTFNLRKGVKFHDGTEFDAQAVKYNLDFWLGAKGATMRSLESVEVIDKNTVRVNLKEYDPLFLFDLSSEPFMMSPTSAEKMGAKEAESHPVGTGPFRFKSYERNVSVKYERNPDYWDEGKPYLDNLEYLVIVNNMTQRSALRAGEIDGIDSARLIDMYKEFEDLGFQSINWGYNHFGLYGDSTKPDSVWANKKFRMAVAHAINKEAISKEAYYGRREVMYQVFAKDNPMYNPDIVPRKYDPEKAKQLLKEAGYPNGVKTTLSFATHDWGPDFDALQGDLLKVGIDAKLIKVQKPKWLQIRFEGGLEGGSGIVINVTAHPLVTMKNFLSGNADTAPDMKRPEGFNELVDKIVAERDPMTQNKLFMQASQMLHDDCTFIPFLQQFQGRIMRQGVHDFINNEYSASTCRWVNTWLSKK